MAYIIAVNATVLSDTGGNCVCNDTTDPLCLNNTEYLICKQDVNRNLITATAAVAGFSSFLFGFLTNMPVCLAPGMGLNAYFAYQIVGFNGSGLISYNLALTAVFIEGFIFIFLSLIGMRQWLVKVIPVSLKIAAACGIGLFLAEVGLSNNAGIGAIAGAKSTPLDIAGCADQYKDEFGQCESHKMTSSTMWLGIMGGGILTAYLMSYKVKSAMILGILLVSIISWPRNTSMTYFPDTEIGNDRFNFFKKVVDFHPINRTLNALDWDVTREPGHFALALFTFLYVDIIDCTATLYSMARFSGVVDPETGDFPRSTIAYCTDAFCISIGALLGCSPVTAFIESGAGIAEGGKTGLTAMICGICFLVSMFFAPIFASIPPWATGCTLILVGCLMMRQITSINWRYIGDAIPAFVTVMFIPFGYSAAYGLIAGLMVYTALNGMIYLTKVISGGYIVPDDENHREYWTSKFSFFFVSNLSQTCSPPHSYIVHDNEEDVIADTVNPVKPAGRLPWFVSAGQTLADRVRGTSRSKQDDTLSIRSLGESDWKYRDRIGSNSSNRDLALDSVTIQALPADPRHEKVFTKLGDK
ncbi:purine transporter [Stemphylium lycopersici]|nr:purine transporter [Stemphylium lycopersici]RAR07728.1 purine transporter [Stemphylium lycopersici]